MKTKKLLASLAIVSIVLFAGCKKDEFVGTKGVCPKVILTDPENLKTGVPVSQIISVTFNEKMNPATITQTSFSLTGTSKISGLLTYDGTTPTFTFAPSPQLSYNTTYTGKVTTAAKDMAGNALQKDTVWTFTTAPQQFTVALSSNPPAGGTTTGGGSFNSGASVSVMATPNAGYTFTNWTEGVTVASTNANYTFTITGNRTLVANFTAIIVTYTVTLSSNPPAGGATTGGGSYNSGASVTVTATANAGYTFTNWTEGVNVVSTNANYTFTITGNRTLVANFTETVNAYTVTLSSNPPAGGATTGGGSFNSGASVTVSATANAGYTFTNWTEGVNVVSYDANYTFTITGNRTLVANFTETVNTYTVTLSSNPPAGGTTTGGGSFNSGVSVTVTATANTGYTFINWTEGVNVVSTNANYTFTITGNRTLVANFSETANTYIITLSSNPPAGGTTAGEGSYISGASVTVAATPNAGYTFTNWTEGANVVSTDANYTFTITGNRTLVANFTATAVTYTITLSSNPSEGGTTTGGGSFISGASVTVYKSISGISGSCYCY